MYLQHELRQSQQTACPFRLQKAAEQPFQFGFLHPIRRTFHHPGHNVQRTAYTDGYGNTQFLQMGIEPLFLLGHAQSCEQQVRLRCFYFSNDSRFVLRLKIAISGTDDFNTGIEFFCFGLGLFRYPGSRTKEEYFLLLTRGYAHKLLCQVVACHPFRHFITQVMGCPYCTGSIGYHQSSCI